MTLNKQALREAAEKATPGQWEMEQENIWYTDAEGYTKHLMYAQQGDDVDDRQDHYNTAFIATANPFTVLALLDELEAAEKRIAELEAREVILPVTIEAHPFGPQLTKMLLELHRNTVNECANAIRAAGIKIKGE